MGSIVRDIFSRFKKKKPSPDIISNYLKVETSANCNARCVWCWMFKSDNKPSGLMKLENFKKFIGLNKDYFKAHNTGIMPFFNGECLIHPDIFEMFDYVLENKLKLMDLDTNLGMKIDVAKLMSYPFKHIRVNIGGITKDVHDHAMKTDFDLVVSNLKQAFKINPKRIYVKMVVTKDNVRQVDQLKDFVKELGGIPDHAIIAPTSFTSPALATDQQKKDFFEDVISEEIDEYLKFDYDIEKPGYDIRSRDNKCNYLLNCVRADGSLTICCQDQLGNLNLGNAFETPIIDLVTSSKYKAVIEKAKNMGFDFCRECN